MQPIIYPLFSVPVYYVPDTNFRIDNDLSNRFLDTTEFPNWIKSSGLSKNMFILDNPEFKDIRRVCEFHLQNYIKTIIGIADEFYITNSWLSRNAPNEEHPTHVHPNSIFSGCLYLKSSRKSELTISSVNHLSKSWPLNFKKTHVNMYNADNWILDVDTGALVIWPSNVSHGSNPNPLDSTRIVMCFNTFVKGDMSSNGYSTNLILQ